MRACAFAGVGWGGEGTASGLEPAQLSVQQPHITGASAFRLACTHESATMMMLSLATCGSACRLATNRSSSSGLPSSSNCPRGGGARSTSMGRRKGWARGDQSNMIAGGGRRGFMRLMGRLLGAKKHVLLLVLL